MTADHQPPTASAGSEEQAADHSTATSENQKGQIIPPYYLLPTTYSGLFLAFAAYLILAFCYFFITPIFEAPDEWTHTGHIKFIAEGNGLPVMLPGQGIWGGQQPPLYYAIGALLVQPFELDNLDPYLKERANPHASLGYALDPGNKNNFLHTPAEDFPYQGLSLTVHLLRLYSVMYGIVTLVFTYFTAREIYDLRFTIIQSPISNLQSPISNLFPTAVALFVACQPMFAFITASVANEPANMAFCAVGLWLAQRYVLYGPTPQWGRAMALGLVIGLISLSKMTGLSFVLVAVTAFLITTIITRKHFGAARLLWRDGVIIGVLVVAVGGWWYWRNYQLYGDFFQRGLYKLYFNVEQQPLTLRDFLYTLSTGEISFWATFGWLNIVAPEWVYSFYRIISRVGLIGAAALILIPTAKWIMRRVEERKNGRIEEQSKPSNLPTFQPSNFSTFQPSNLPTLLPFLLHLIFPVALAFSLTRLVAIEGGLQGRQLLPALGSMAIVIVGGWWVLAPARLRLPVLAVVIGLMGGLAIWLPFGVLAPEYTPKPLLTEADLPADLVRLDLIYRGEMKLIGVQLGAAKVCPGQRVPVTAYWQALRPMTTNYSVFIHLIGRSYQDVGQFNTYPGLGLRPTHSLEPGQIVADTYPVLVYGGAQTPTRLLVNLGLFDFNEPGRPGIEPTDTNDQPVSSTVGQLKLVPVEWPALPTNPPAAEFNESGGDGTSSIVLADYDIVGCQAATQPCEISFKWLAQVRPSADYTVFIQFWPADPQQQFIGFDAPPLVGDYPTSLWEPGEIILDPHELNISALPPGKYRILTGLYNLTTGQRLAASAAGTPLPDQAVNLGVLPIR